VLNTLHDRPGSDITYLPRQIDVIAKLPKLISLFHRAFFNSIMYKTPTHALFVQHYIILTC